MKILKISVTSDARIKDITGVFKATDADKVVFICPRDFSVLTDISFVKKIKNAAEGAGKEVAFVCSQKIIRDALKSQNLEAYSTVVKELEEGEIISLSDFYNPKSVEKEPVKTLEVLTEEGEVRPAFSVRKIEEVKLDRSVRGQFFFGFLLVLLLLGVLWFWIAPHAEIILKPQTSLIPVTQNVMIVLPEAKIPPKEEHLPQVQGIYVETEIIGTEVFPATGRVYDLTNAHGKVTLYNESSSPKPLVPSRLEAPNGAIFRFSKNVTIPARNANGPGSLVVEVLADEYDSKELPIGERGNIDAGTALTFPALRGPLKEMYYAKANQGPLVGGSTLTHYFVEPQSFEVAKEVLTETFHTRGIERLRAEIKSRSEREGRKYVLLDDPRLLKSEVMEAAFPEQLVGQETQTFEVNAKLKMFGVVFDQSQVAEFLEQKLRLTQDQVKKLIELDQNSAVYQIMVHEKLAEEKWAKISVSMQGVESLDMTSDAASALQWREDLKKVIAGRDISEARSILTNFPEIDNVLEIKISPFWSKRIPTILNQIEFGVRGGGQ